MNHLTREHVRAILELTALHSKASEPQRTTIDLAITRLLEALDAEKRREIVALMYLGRGDNDDFSRLYEESAGWNALAKLEEKSRSSLDTNLRRGLEKLDSSEVRLP